MSWSKQSSQKKALSVGLVFLTLVAGIVIGTLLNTGVRADRPVATDATPLTIPSPTQLANDFTVLVNKLEPTVVNIQTDYTISAAQLRRGPRPQGDEEEESNPLDLFRRFGLPEPDEAPQNRRGGGTGSGFIVDAKGYIITNFHVVERADKIKVKLHGDAHEYEARLIGVDNETDLAVIKIDASRALPFAAVGNSDGVQVGDWAVAIGSPFGLEASVTAGIVSAKGRDIGTQQFQRFIQTDAAINPGNSGGPLLNIQGQVIGVNTMIATNNGGYQGIGFALPINMAVKVYNQLITTGKVTRGSIGISFKPLPPDTLKALGVDHGVVIGEVVPGGPAERGGLRKNDIILSLDGKAIADGDDLVARVSDTPLDKKVRVTVDRDGKRADFDVAVADRVEVHKDNPRISATLPQSKEEEVDVPATRTDVKFGFMVADLLPAQREEMGIEADRGVRISTVLENTFAEEIGLQEGDVVLSINRKPIGSVEDIRRVQSTLKPGDPVAFYVMKAQPSIRGRGRTQFITDYVSGTLPR